MRKIGGFGLVSLDVTDSRTICAEKNVETEEYGGQYTYAKGMISTRVILIFTDLSDIKIDDYFSRAHSFMPQSLLHAYTHGNKGIEGSLFKSLWIESLSIHVFSASN